MLRKHIRPAPSTYKNGRKLGTRLFAVPSQPLSPSFPLRLPGITEESGKALVETLKEDYIKYHVFFDTVGRHNHTAHHLVTLYALGADNTLIHTGLKENAKIQMPAFDSPGSINAQNVFDHLGDSKYYQGYLRFFVDQLTEQGIAAVLEEFIFSDKANLGLDKGQKQPHMLARFLASFLHPMIQLGYGCELNMLGLVAEGLAQTAVHYADDHVLLPPSVFDSTSSSTGLASALSSISLTGEKEPDHGVHSLTILSQAIDDPLFAPVTPDHRGDIPELRGNDERAKARLARIVDLSEQWAKDVDCSKPDTLDAKIEELAFMNTLIYIMQGTHAGDDKPFYADFFLAHLVTSSLFLSPIAHFLTPASQTRFLQAYFSTCLSSYVVRGRRNSDISKLFTTAMPTVPSKVSFARGALKTEHDGTPWLALIKSGIAHPEAHVSKMIRVLAHWAHRYGDRPAGHFAGLAEGPDGLKGADKIDGTLFVRAALLNTSKLGWVGEGEAVGSWDIFITGFRGPPPPPMIKQ